MFKESVGKGEFANMPQEKVVKSWPKPPMASDREIDDTITGIDKVQTQGASKRKSNLSNQK